MAYAISRADSEIGVEIQVMDLENQKMSNDTVNWVKFSGISWYKDGFYYSGYDAPKKGNEYSKKRNFTRFFITN